MAIAIVLPDSGRVELADTFRPRGRALNGLGDSVQADLVWSSLDSTLEILDRSTGVARATFVGTARLQARAGNLFSNPHTVTIREHLDSLRALGAKRDTVSAPDSLSDSLSVQAYATGGVPQGRRVVYAFTIFPDSNAVVTLVPNDTVFTSAGLAATRVRLMGTTIPDSVVVTAAMRHANGTLVPDTVVFVVEFRQ